MMTSSRMLSQSSATQSRAFGSILTPSAKSALFESLGCLFPPMDQRRLALRTLAKLLVGTKSTPGSPSSGSQASSSTESTSTTRSTGKTSSSATPLFVVQAGGRTLLLLRPQSLRVGPVSFTSSRTAAWRQWSLSAILPPNRYSGHLRVFPSSGLASERKVSTYRESGYFQLSIRLPVYGVQTFFLHLSETSARSSDST